MEVLDLVIIGGGPAGVTAAIYAKRAGLKFRLLEKLFIGGKILTTTEIENVTGFSKLTGMNLSEKLSEHLSSLEITSEMVDVLEIEKLESKFVVKTKNEEIQTKNIIIATGASSRKLNVQGEEKFASKGVSYCATCDGMFYKDKNVLIIGGGDTGFTSAQILSRIAKNVYLMQHNEILKANMELQNKVKELSNVQVILNAEVKEILGNEKTESVDYIDKYTNEIKNLKVDGVFVNIGVLANSELAKNLCELDNFGAIRTNEDMQTSTKGIYAIGDVRDTKVRQVLTAMSDAVYALEKIAKEI